MTNAKIKSDMEILLRTAELTTLLDDHESKRRASMKNLNRAIERMRDYLDSCVGAHYNLGALDEEVAKLRFADQEVDRAMQRMRSTQDQLNLLRWVVGGE